MTEESKATQATAEGDRHPDPTGIELLEGRLARLEAQVRANSERLAELDQGARAKKQQALMLRVLILVLALGAFFYLRMRGLA